MEMENSDKEGVRQKVWQNFDKFVEFKKLKNALLYLRHFLFSIEEIK